MSAAELSFPTPVGELTVVSDDDAITAVAWRRARSPKELPLLLEARAQLQGYFEGTRKAFDLPIDVRASRAQKDVCAEMALIPYGETLTYGDIAGRVGLPPQAVGAACGGNPIPVIIPCHRVLGANSLGGFQAVSGSIRKFGFYVMKGPQGF